MRKILIYIIAIIVFFIIGLILANFIIMPAVVRMGQEVVVPNVCNLPLDTAIAVLKQLGLQGVVVERRYDSVIDEGKVIIQEPLPDTKVKKGRIVNLSVSLGSETINVPFLLGLDLEKGRLIIEKLGLIVEKVESLFSDSIPIGKIIKTIPEFETELKKGEGIKLIVSKGIVREMPNLIGMNINEAKEVLKNLGLIIKEIKEVEGSGAKGSILVQTPESNKIVNLGDSVSLMVIK